MAGHSFMFNGSRCFIDYADGEGSVMVNGRLWRWTFHEYLGPVFIRKDGEPRRCQWPTQKAVWTAFEAWLKKYNSAKRRFPTADRAGEPNARNK
jgi:hypothetical protein